MSYFEDVGDFHRHIGIPARDKKVAPHLLSDEDQVKREAFHVEELGEYHDAVVAGDLPKIADAIADLVYVLLGTANMMSIPFDDVWCEVQAANMRKVRAEEGQTDGGAGRSYSFGVRKPPGWQPPDIDRILSEAFAIASTGEERTHDGPSNDIGW